MTKANTRAPSRRLLLASHGGVAALVLAMGASAYAQAPASQPAEEDEAIVVTGTYLSTDQARLAAPVTVINAEQIAGTGRAGLDDLLVFNTANTGSVGGAQDLVEGGNDNHATRSANLRGLGATSTLVLLNGRRVASAEGYTNLVGLVPTIAVNRFETLLDGASALYGSDAIAGVINVITDKRFTGMRLQGQYIDIADAPAYNIQAMIGGGDDRFHGVISASFEHQEGLQNSDRDISSFYNPSGASHPGRFTVNARPVGPGGADVIINNGVNGPINYSQRYTAAGTAAVTFADPYCGTPQGGGVYVATSTTVTFPVGACNFSFQDDNPLIPETEVALVHASATYQVQGGPEVYMEARYYHQESLRKGIGSYGITGALTVPANNPGNPFGVTATIPTSTFRVRGDGSPYRMQRDQIDAKHFVIGVRDELGMLPAGWNYDLSYTWSHENQTFGDFDTDLLSLQNALNGFGGPNCIINTNGSPAAGQSPGVGACLWYSPFAINDATNPADVLYNMVTPIINGATAEYGIFEGIVTGELFQLPGGPVGIAFGANLRQESGAVRYDGLRTLGRLGFYGRAIPGGGSRDVVSEFVELQLPVLDTLDVQMAVRHEDYDAFTTTDPKVGVNWRPLESLSIRATYGTAFRAPTIAQTVSTAVTTFTAQTRDTHLPVGAPPDPGTFRTVNVVPNANLGPEQSTNYNAGITWEPIENLRFSVDYWKFEFEDQISQEGQQAVIDANLPGGPVRDGAGNLIAVNVRSFNAGGTQTDGVDFRAEYTFDWGDNVFNIVNNATRVNSYTIQPTVGSATFDIVGRRNANNAGPSVPQWRNNLTLGWQNGRQNANVAMRYVGSVLDDLGVALTATPTLEIDSWTVYDVQYSIGFGEDERVRATIGAINVFDDEPPISRANLLAGAKGYNASIHDALGRQAYVRLSLDL
ncbi:MAG: TonB-dependent receptor [Hyphomonadaceae bacterium]|nr:TonB-dependent receptor [Hyphomonadaceae bacterium]